jgi:hypothetical protein
MTSVLGQTLVTLFPLNTGHVQASATGEVHILVQSDGHSVSVCGHSQRTFPSCSGFSYQSFKDVLQQSREENRNKR